MRPRSRSGPAPRPRARRRACRRRRRRTPRGRGCPSGRARRASRPSRRGTPSCGRAPRRRARPPGGRSRARCRAAAAARRSGRSPCGAETRGQAPLYQAVPERSSTRGRDLGARAGDARRRRARRARRRSARRSGGRSITPPQSLWRISTGGPSACESVLVAAAPSARSAPARGRGPSRSGSTRGGRALAGTARLLEDPLVDQELEPWRGRCGRRRGCPGSGRSGAGPRRRRGSRAASSARRSAPACARSSNSVRIHVPAPGTPSVGSHRV